MMLQNVNSSRKWFYDDENWLKFSIEGYEIRVREELWN